MHHTDEASSGAGINVNGLALHGISMTMDSIGDGISADADVVIYGSLLNIEAAGTGVLSSAGNIDIQSSRVCIESGNSGIHESASGETKALRIGRGGFVYILSDPGACAVKTSNAVSFERDGTLSVLLPKEGEVANAAAEILIDSSNPAYNWSEDYVYTDTHHWHPDTTGLLSSLPFSVYAAYPAAAYAEHSDDLDGDNICDTCECFMEKNTTVYVGGLGLVDGEYLTGNGVISMSKPTSGYAYYENGTLTLHDYVYEGAGHSYGDQCSAATCFNTDLPLC